MWCSTRCVRYQTDKPISCWKKHHWHCVREAILTNIGKWLTWINTKMDDIITTKLSLTRPYAYVMGHTVCWIRCIPSTDFRIGMWRAAVHVSGCPDIWARAMHMTSIEKPNELNTMLRILRKNVFYLQCIIQCWLMKCEGHTKMSSIRLYNKKEYSMRS